MFEEIATEIEDHESRGFMDARNSSLWLTAHVQGEDIEKQRLSMKPFCHWWLVMHWYLESILQLSGGGERSFQKGVALLLATDAFLYCEL